MYLLSDHDRNMLTTGDRIDIRDTITDLTGIGSDVDAFQIRINEIRRAEERRRVRIEQLLWQRHC
jgi:hypothetical protein